MKSRFLKLLFVGALGITLTSCGGGGGNGDNDDTLGYAIDNPTGLAFCNGFFSLELTSFADQLTIACLPSGDTETSGGATSYTAIGHISNRNKDFDISGVLIYTHSYIVDDLVHTATITFTPDPNTDLDLAKLFFKSLGVQFQQGYTDEDVRNQLTAPITVTVHYDSATATFRTIAASENATVLQLVNPYTVNIKLTSTITTETEI